MLSSTRDVCCGMHGCSQHAGTRASVKHGPGTWRMLDWTALYACLISKGPQRHHATTPTVRCHVLQPPRSPVLVRMARDGVWVCGQVAAQPPRYCRVVYQHREWVSDAGAQCHSAVLVCIACLVQQPRLHRCTGRTDTASCLMIIKCLRGRFRLSHITAWRFNSLSTSTAFVWQGHKLQLVYESDVDHTQARWQPNRR